MKDENLKRGRNKRRRLVYDKACKSKARFTDEPQARAGALVAIENPRNGDAPVTCLWVYKCPHCFGWHMTHSAKSDRWKVELEARA